jgi:two-component system, NarL family, sensor histidine kinase NreB
MEREMINQASNYIIQSQEEEIKRIALELHEGVSQNLYSISTGLDFLQSVMNQPELKEMAQGLAHTLNRTLQEVRLLAVELYPTTLASLGLTAALKSYIKLYTSTFGIIVHIDSEGKDCAISESKSLAIFRSCQEALINIAKYADVTTAILRITWQEGYLKIMIEDKGKGFDFLEAMKENRLMGISAIKQRMKIANGDMKVSSEIGKGTKITLELPLER